VQLAIAMGMPVRPDGGIDYAQTITMRDTPEYKTWFGWYSESRCHEIGTTRWGSRDFDLKTLRTDADSQDGYLIPQVMDAFIRRNISEISPVRRHARQRIAHSKTLDIPRRLSIPIAQYEGEAETANTDQSIYGSEQVTCYRQTVNIPATLDMMVSAAFDIENEIVADTGESFAQGEGLNFVKGNGRKGPQGILNDTRVVGYTTENTGTITWDDFVAMSGQLKRGYEPWYYLNRRTLAAMQGLTSSIGVPIWQPVAGNQPANIWGFPYDSRSRRLSDRVGRQARALRRSLVRLRSPGHARNERDQG
jgi:HK97 family phage major capsid protein